MDPQTDLSQFLSEFPDLQDFEIQSLVSRKKEFEELQSSPTEPMPARKGELFKYQEFAIRYMRQQPRVLMAFEPGTGKSCTFVGLAEWYRREHAAGRGRIKGAYWLVRGPILQAEAKKQILYACNEKSVYITEEIESAYNMKHRRSLITRKINEWYRIMTYYDFAAEVVGVAGKKAPYSDSDIIDKFNDTLIFVDEAHNLRNAEEISRRTKVKKTEVNQYDVLRRVFEVASECRVILGTATPMVNRASEISTIMNLILPKDSLMPSNAASLSAYELEPYFRGRVLYVRNVNSEIVVVPQGEAPAVDYDYNNQTYTMQTVLQTLPMSDFQLEGYMRAKKIGETDEGGTTRRTTRMPESRPGDPSYRGGMTEGVTFRLSEGDTFRRDSSFQGGMTEGGETYFPEDEEGGSNAFKRYTLQAGLFVFPDAAHSTGGPAYRKYITQTKRGFDFTTTQGGKATTRAVQSPTTLQEVSCKFSFMIDYIRNQPYGTSFCYSDYKEGSGVVLLALCFRNQGFEEFRDYGTVVWDDAEGGTTTPSETFPAALTKKLRYALITSTISDSEIQAILYIFNSYENRNGEYIKTVIVSRKARDGINLANVLSIFIANPPWNAAGGFQAESRGIRSGSHRAIRELMIQEGVLKSSDPTVVKVFRLAAVGPGGSLTDPEGDLYDDISTYRDGEKKDREIKRVLRIMKQCAVDCIVQASRNLIPEGKDGTPECDYTSCLYPCIPGPSRDIDTDTSTYDLDYSGPLLGVISSRVRESFRRKSRMSFQEIMHEVSGGGTLQFPPKYLMMTLSAAISFRTVFLNRQGYRCFLYTDEGIFFLSRDYPHGAAPSFLSSYYTSSVVWSAVTPVSMAVGRGEDVRKAYQAWVKANPKNPKVTFDVDLRVALFEVLFGKKDLTPAEKEFVDFYSAGCFRLNPDVAENWRDKYRALDAIKVQGRKPQSAKKDKNMISKLTDFYEGRTNRGPGALRDPESPLALDYAGSSLALDWQADAPTSSPVFIHVLDNLRVAESSGKGDYNVTSIGKLKNNRLRLWDPEGQVWTEITSDIDFVVYNVMVYSLLLKDRFSDYYQWAVDLRSGKGRLLPPDPYTDVIQNLKNRRRGLNVVSVGTMAWAYADMVQEDPALVAKATDYYRSHKPSASTLKEVMASLREDEVEATTPDIKVVLYWLWSQGELTTPALTRRIQDFIGSRGRIIYIPT